MGLREELIRLAHAVPETRKHLVPLLRQATEFDSEEALQKYLQEHPDSDRSKHTVKKEEDHRKEHGKKKTELEGKIRFHRMQITKHEGVLNKYVKTPPSNKEDEAEADRAFGHAEYHSKELRKHEKALKEHGDADAYVKKMTK